MATTLECRNSAFRPILPENDRPISIPPPKPLAVALTISKKFTIFSTYDVVMAVGRAASVFNRLKDMKYDRSYHLDISG